MLLPATALTVLLAMLSGSSRKDVREEAMRLGLEIDPDGRLQVPRLWFSEDPTVVPSPFAWGSSREVGVVRHPYRTVHVLMKPKAFLELTNTQGEVLERQRDRVLQSMLEPASRMVSGEEAPNFPLPFLGLSHRDGSFWIRSHEGRHRALLAIELGLEVLPVVFVVQDGPEGWEHQRDSIDEDPFVKMITLGKSPLIHQQVWRDRRGRWVSLTPLAPDGTPLLRALLTLKDRITGSF